MRGAANDIHPEVRARLAHIRFRLPELPVPARGAGPDFLVAFWDGDDGDGARVAVAYEAEPGLARAVEAAGGEAEGGGEVVEVEGVREGG